MEQRLLLLAILTLNVFIIVLFFVFLPKNNDANKLLQNQLQVLQSNLDKIETGIKNISESTDMKVLISLKKIAPNPTIL